MVHLRHPAVVALVLVTLSTSLFVGSVRAQVEPPSRNELFREETRTVKALRKEERAEIFQADRPETDQLDFKAPQVEYLRDRDEVVAKGGAILSRSGIQAQADQATINIKTQDTQLEGNVRMSGDKGGFSASSGSFNMESEIGEFADATISFDEGNYDAVATRLKKLSDTEYQLFDVGLTTCQCEEDETRPWIIGADKVNLTRDGYAHAYDSVVRLYDVPIFYSPYIGFPIKEERQTGLLMPSVGYSSKDGTVYRQSLFTTLSDSSDLTVTPFIETQTRGGAWFDYRQAFSRYNNASARFLFSNESARGGSLRGLETDGNFKSTGDVTPFDENRMGLLYEHLWRTAPQSELPLMFISDVHYVSDRYLLREIEGQEDIGEISDRYTTSKMLLRSDLGGIGTAELSGEQNQALYSDDNSLVLQRKPELFVSGLKSFRPFGFNPYGLKVVTRGIAQSTSFDRREGYDGMRTDLNPNVALPFHVGSYFNGSVYGGYHYTHYDMRETLIPGSSTELDDKSYRSLFNLGYSMSTAVERVYESSPDGILGTFSGLGAKNQAFLLRRVKHVIEPFARYDYVPKNSQQADLPFYDSLDRIHNRSQFGYGITTRLLGRFLPEASGQEPIPELAPRVEDLPGLDVTTPLGDVSEGLGWGSTARFARQGEIRELASLTIQQTYDYAIDSLQDEELENYLVEPDPFSAISTELTLTPSKSFAFEIESDYDATNMRPVGWQAGISLFSDRGDALRAAYSYVYDYASQASSIDQLEANVEIVLLRQLRAAYYTRYDDRTDEFIENGAALRIFGAPANSGLDCWHLDIGYADKINPDRQSVFMTFTFNGLGDISSGIWGRTLGGGSG